MFTNKIVIKYLLSKVLNRFYIIFALIVAVLCLSISQGFAFEKSQQDIQSYYPEDLEEILLMGISPYEFYTEFKSSGLNNVDYLNSKKLDEMLIMGLGVFPLTGLAGLPFFMTDLHFLGGMYAILNMMASLFVVFNRNALFGLDEQWCISHRKDCSGNNFLVNLFGGVLIVNYAISVLYSTLYPPLKNKDINRRVQNLNVYNELKEKDTTNVIDVSFNPALFTVDPHFGNLIWNSSFSLKF